MMHRLFEFDTSSELLEFILKFLETRIVSLKKFKAVLIALSITLKGLTVSEILEIVLIFLMIGRDYFG